MDVEIFGDLLDVFAVGLFRDGKTERLLTQFAFYSFFQSIHSLCITFGIQKVLQPICVALLMDVFESACALARGQQWV